MDKQIAEYQQWVEDMQASGYIDQPKYQIVQSFLLANDARRREDTQFEALKHAFDALAAVHGRQSIREMQENFGLNSCAQ